MKEYTNNELLLQVQNLGVTYGTKKIISNISFDITNVKVEGLNQGQCVAVVARSGRGKSTLFKALAGLIKFDGSINICNDHDQSLSAMREGNIGFVQQKYPLSRNQTVNSMLLQAASLGGINSDERQAVVDDRLKEWNLLQQKFLAPNQLSGGQQQRASILEQMLCSKHFIILDEPFSGLDVKNKMEAKYSFDRISQADDFNTIIFSTHEIELAVELADLIIVIGYETDNNGNFIEVGTLLQVFDLKKMGIAWTDFGQPHIELQKEIENLIINS